MKVAVLLQARPSPAAALLLARGLQPDRLTGVCVVASEDELSALTTGPGLDEVLALVDPGLAAAGPREQGHALAALLATTPPELVLVDPLADRDEGVLASWLAHHLRRPILLRVTGIAAAGPDAVTVQLPVAGRLHDLKVTGPAVIGLAALDVPPGQAARQPAELRVKTLAEVGLPPEDLLEPSPPATFIPGRPRVVAVSHLAELLDKGP